VVVAVAVVGVVQVTVHQVAGVVAVGHGFVAAVGTVDVALFVTRADVAGGASGRILVRHFDAVMLHAGSRAGMMKMAVMQVIHMVIVLDGRVAAILAVLVIVISTVVLIRHRFVLPNF
jgi:hypothetical protein